MNDNAVLASLYPDLTQAEPPPAEPVVEDETEASLLRHASRLLGAPAYLYWTGGSEEVRALRPPPAPPPGVAQLCERVCASGEALTVADAARETGVAGLGAFLGVPLRLGGASASGCLCVVAGGARDWTGDDVEGLREVGVILLSSLALRRDAYVRRALENRVRMLEKAVENMQLGVTVTDLEGRIVYTNPAEARMHGYAVSELQGRHARILGPPELYRALDTDHIQGAGSWTRESVNVRRDGSRFPVLLWSDMVADAGGEPIGIVTCCEDITERKRAEQALRDVALRDPLTGLPNRVHFLDRLTQAISQVERAGDGRFAVLFLDLDRFKVVNDSLGHHVGDELLAVIARRLLGCLRPTDTVARFGGDEFAVLLEDISDLDEATHVATRIQETLRTPIHLDGYELFTSASIGIVLGTSGSDQPEYLWRSADMAMYRAKAAGTGRFEVFDRAMHADALAKLQLETDLRRAVEHGEFRLHYQPIVSLRQGAVVGFEALIRWEHPLRGMIYPAEFIGATEETGLIIPIGEWVLREAALQLAKWQTDSPRPEPLWMSVNLSSKQLSQSTLADHVEAVLRETGVDATTLKLEITESAVMENTDIAAEVLGRLKELRVQLYMDDFGTGYSSLSYLHRLPLDALKIDRAFINHLEREDKHGQLVRTILSLARSVNLQVVAEGVTTEHQLHLLREWSCEYGQGYLFAKPMPAAAAGEMLRNDPRW